MEEFEKETIQENRLDDIVLQKYEKREKLKKLALLGVSGLVVLILVVAIVKFFLDSSSTPQDSLVEESVITQNEEDAENEFEEVPILATQEEAEPKEDLNAIVQDVLNEEKAQPTQQLAPAPKPAPKPKPAVTHTPPKKKSIERKPKKVAKKSFKGGYYVQVGAFSKYAPDRAFLKKITANGFDYRIKEVTIGGKRIKKVLIGPYPSKDAAKKVLPKIRKSIAQGAFIIRF